MKALVVGASGLVGEHLCQVLCERGHQVWGTYHRNYRPGLLPLDILDREAPRELVARVRPDVVLHPAAMPDVERCEAFPSESYQVNVTGLAHVVEAANIAGARLVHFSSEYVFDGLAGPYSEEDTPNPLNVYGRQKLVSEELARSRAPGALIIRTTVVYGWERRVRNFAGRLITELRAGRPVKAPLDQISSPTYVVDLAESVCELAARGAGGLYHVAGAERVNRYVFARVVAEIFELDADLIVPILTAELGRKTPRPLAAGLDVRKLTRELGRAPAGLRDGLARMKKEKMRWMAD
jgi:dTDP-4-dehydrorhamnose reductase